MSLLKAKIAEHLESMARSMATALGSKLPKGIGFALFLFEFGGPGKWCTYISNADREDMVSSVEDFLTHDDGGELPLLRKVADRLCLASSDEASEVQLAAVTGELHIYLREWVQRYGQKYAERERERAAAREQAS